MEEIKRKKHGWLSPARPALACRPQFGRLPVVVASRIATAIGSCVFCFKKLSKTLSEFEAKVFFSKFNDMNSSLQTIK